MSDTPLADALKDYYCFSHLDWYYLCCEVERENAKLHAEVKVTRQNYETCKRENAALREELEYAIKAGAKREADLLVMLGKEPQP